MESTKDITLKDMDNTLHFRIRLFGAEKGLDFIDNSIGKIKNSSAFSVKPFLDDLLPLASLMDANGQNVIKEGLDRQTCFSMFQNPLTILELGIEILKFQEVFLKNSAFFQELTNILPNSWNTKITELKMQ